MTRIPIPDESQVVGELPDRLSDVDVGKRTIRRAVGNNPRILAELLEHTRVLYDELPSAVRELVILAVARTTRSRYEWHQHVPMARSEGISMETIRAIGADAYWELAGDDRAVVSFVRSQCRGDTTDDDYERLADRYDEDDVVAIGILAGQYRGVADFVAAIDLQPEGDFVGWVPEE